MHIERLRHKVPRAPRRSSDAPPTDHLDLLLSGKDCAVAWVNGAGAPYADVVAASNAFGRRELLVIKVKETRSECLPIDLRREVDES